MNERDYIFAKLFNFNNFDSKTNRNAKDKIEKIRNKIQQNYKDLTIPNETKTFAFEIPIGDNFQISISCFPDNESYVETALKYNHVLMYIDEIGYGDVIYLNSYDELVKEINRVLELKNNGTLLNYYTKYNKSSA